VVLIEGDLPGRMWGWQEGVRGLFFFISVILKVSTLGYQPCKVKSLSTEILRISFFGIRGLSPVILKSK
jgi:hypothetical protein